MSYKLKKASQALQTSIRCLEKAVSEFHACDKEDEPRLMRNLQLAQDRKDQAQADYNRIKGA